ncbi:MAG: MtrB/PioB family outer membrane beta-barrel protein [Betaproteobacteria bacterium]|nr:MtrB/PioB family outer membrane beta-barrel protein [Betaproteobacteria bacterium]MCC6248944.1 MtrB/PioB family outer membrane beta-barrel protein [Rubrivivax sp.]MCL4695893.1 MtrB/PioB family outer membrane beta-barrel protein [Burkholderiaceae bacterium]
MDTQNPRRARLALACIASLASAGALAQEPNPYYVGASQSLVRESNLFRVDDAASPTRDTVSVTSLLAGIDQPIGRQRLFADFALRAVRHDESKDLNHTGGNLLVGLDWSAADAFEGRLSASRDRALARYGADLGFTAASGKVLQTADEFVARGQYGLVSLLSLEAGYTRRELDFSVESGNAFEQDTVSAGVKYRPGGALTLGLGVRRTDGSFPYAGPTGAAVRSDDYDRNDVDLQAVWVPTGASMLTARLSRTSEDHEGFVVREVRTTTGLVSWNYKPTGKLGVTASYVRDTGAETTFSQRTPGAAAVSSPLATAGQVEVDYLVTGKIKAQLMARRLNRDLVDATGVLPAGEDSLTEYRLGVEWSPLRSLTVGCGVGRERRSTASALSYAYSANVTRCMAQFRTQ